MKKFKAISYLRYSSKGQSRGTSEERQEDSFNLWLSQNSDKYISYQPFRDLGMSGYSGKHLGGDLGRLLELAKQGTFEDGDLLVIEALDRLSRLVPLDAFDLVREIVKSGLSIYTLEDNQKYSKETLNTNELALTQLIWKLQGAHSYSKRLGTRVAAAHAAKRAKAIEGKADKVVAAVWLKNGKLLSPFSGMVKTAVEMYLDGYGTRAIAIKLTEIVKTASEQEGGNELRKRYKRPIGARTVHRWLVNPALNGHWKSKDGLREKCFEPLIDSTTWLALEAEIKKRAGKFVSVGVSKHYELSGLVKCSCKAPFTVRVQKPSATKAEPLGSPAYLAKPPILYMNCSSYLKDGGCANNSTWPYQVFKYIYEQTISTCLHQIALSIPIRQEIKKALEALDEELSKLERQRQAVANLYIDTLEDSYRKKGKEIDEKLVKVKSKKSLLVSENAALATNTGLTEFDDDYVFKPISCEPWEQADDVGKRQVLKAAGYEIAVDNKKATCSYGVTGREVWELICRKQISKTYIVYEEVPEIKTKTDYEGGYSRYLAIEQTGKAIATAESRDALDEQLVKVA